MTNLFKDQRTLLLLDGFGAIISAILLGIVLVHFQPYFGMPVKTLYFLAALPCCFAIYDFVCYLRVSKNIGFYLELIAIVNLLYCCLSIGLAVYHAAELTSLGWSYIIIEVIVVVGLSLVELKAARL